MSVQHFSYVPLAIAVATKFALSCVCVCVCCCHLSQMSWHNNLMQFITAGKGKQTKVFAIIINTMQSEEKQGAK